MKSQYNRIIEPVTRFIRQQNVWIATVLLMVMFGLSLSSMKNNSAIVDEIAHIPAGYSYMHYGDYRLNPEHPPLIKDLAGLPLQFMNLKFPVNEPSWTSDINGQWEAGWNFIYHLGNNADAILFWARLPILLLAIGFGAFLYWFVRKRWGIAAGLTVLFFYTLSPNFLGHDDLVTTDLGASAFIFLGLLSFVYFADKPSAKRFWLLSLGLAGANLAKFSGFLLYPFLLVVALMLVWLAKNPGTVAARLKTYVLGLIGASVASVVWIWIYYIPNTWNMPLDVQDRLIKGSLPDSHLQFVVHLLTAVNSIPLVKALAQYLLGLTMVYGRVTGGNTTYFNGMVTNQSFHGYFPELFSFKTQIALLILMVIPVVIVTKRFLYLKHPFVTIADHMRTHVLEWTVGGFAAFYFLISVAGNLNLGIRHILPIYVPIFVLVGVATVRRLRLLERTRWAGVSAAVFALLMVWYGGSTIAAHPNYISYFNEFIGGGGNAYKYFTDSSVDWGQDLKRLKTYVDNHPEINHIALDYFGGGSPQYYFCNRKYTPAGQLVATSDGYDCTHSVYQEWHSQYGPYTGQYIAVSETFLYNDLWYSELNHTTGYDYLRAKKPIAKVGNSIYVYQLY